MHEMLRGMKKLGFERRSPAAVLLQVCSHGVAGQVGGGGAHVFQHRRRRCRGSQRIRGILERLQQLRRPA
jgi:hypothetical protein